MTQLAKKQTKQRDIPNVGVLLRKHGHWYGSMKTLLQGQWLIAFCYGIFVSEHDTEVEHSTPDEMMHSRIVGSWQMWTAAEGLALSFTDRYQTVQQGPIRLRQFLTETQHAIYLMENLFTYLPKEDWSFWYVPAHRAVLIKDQGGQPRAVFAEFVPQIPIRPVEQKNHTPQAMGPSRRKSFP